MMIEGEEGKKRNIVYICDENYLLPTIVSAQSLLENISSSEESLYKVHICAVSISPEDQKRFCSLGSGKAEVCIHNIDRQKYLKLYENIRQKTYVTLTALLKFELPDILSGIDEALYLDSDVIVNQSLSPIFDCDISDYALAASFDMVLYRALSNYEKPLKKPSEFYFNSGVMLLNLKKFRRENYTEKLREAKLALSDSDNALNLMDQNVLNQVLSKECLPFPIRFNCPNQYPASLGVDIRDINNLYGTDYRDTVELLDDAVVIHYIGRKSKPWAYKNCACRELWDYYCDRAGMDSKALSRITDPDHKRGNLSRYAGKAWKLLKTGGVPETVRYILRRIKLKRKGR